MGNCNMVPNVEMVVSDGVGNITSTTLPQRAQVV